MTFYFLILANGSLLSTGKEAPLQFNRKAKIFLIDEKISGGEE